MRRHHRAAPTPQLGEYVDFVIHAQRVTPRTVDVMVYASPVGAMAEPARVSFAASRAQWIRQSFRSSARNSYSGRMLITQTDAIRIGKELSAVLFPPAVFRLLALSLAETSRRQIGLRIRLAFDAELIDLPWEYTYRPDRMTVDAVSGFLLLDPAISMVRESASPRIALKPIAGRSRLTFIGAISAGDAWEVGREFSALKRALKPVSNYLVLTFTPATEPEAFAAHLNSAILHYAGHCDFDANGRAYLVRELPSTGQLAGATTVTIDDFAPRLSTTQTRLVVMSGCNTGFWPAVKPLLAAGIPAVVAVNGAITTVSAIQFCAKLYESLAVGLTLDEAVARARLRALKHPGHQGVFDWGLFMVYMPSPQAALFARPQSRAVMSRQAAVRRAHGAVIDSTLRLARELDGMNFGEIMSNLAERRVLILGRFTGRRLKVLEAVKRHLAEHAHRYVPELFTFAKPGARDLVESIVGFAALSRFIVADLSEPKSVQSELEAIVPRFLSVPVVPIINRTGKEYATFSSIQRRESVVKPTVRYRNAEDLLEKMDDDIVSRAEAKLVDVRQSPDEAATASGRKPRFALCLQTDEFDHLQAFKVYPVLPDQKRPSVCRVIDDSGQPHLYPQRCFVFLQLPKVAERALTSSLRK